MIACGIKFFQSFRIRNSVIEFLFGALLTVVLVVAVYVVTKYAIAFVHHFGFWYGYVTEIILCYFIIAPKALKDESMKVCRSLQADDLQGARKNLSRIVGRDTQHLESPEIVRATVETVAENFSDGLTAPLFFVVLGGVPLGMAYKAVNTLDSMIGYRNEKYEYFGKFAARLDDVANYIPARLSAILMLTAAFVTKKNAGRAFRIYRRDRRKHKSPNSAQTESVCAGALGLQLGGDSYYDGKLVSKPTIGDAAVAPVPLHIVEANRLMYTATIIGIFVILCTQALWRYANV
jgi:adenosylcobinamide-phosphate synthase